jgi:hypothetical protein
MTLRQLKIFLNIFIIIFACTSCSDNHSNTYEPESETAIISGIITDPPIKDAKVFPIAKDTLKPFPFNDSSAKTDENGNFSLIVKKDDLGNISHIESFGGSDTKTGVSFKDLSFKAYFENDKKTNLVVSPLTTLIYHMISTNKMTFEEAETKTASIFDLDPGISPSANPLSDNKLLIANMITAYTAVSVNKENPFKLTAEILVKKDKFIQNNQIDENILYEITESTETSNSVQNHYQAISSGKSADEIISSSKSFQTKTLFFNSLKSLIKDDYSDFEAKSEIIKNNLKLITDKISGEIIPLETNTTVNILRYILNEYDLAQISLNSDDEYEFKGIFFEQNLTEGDLYNSDNIFISEDKKLKNLISDSAYFIHDISVLSSEMPGNDNSKRVNYYFNSDISHLYLASQTLDSVFDDTKRDYIQTQIVKGYASAGLFDKAELIADTQIFTPAEKGTAYIEIGRQLLDFSNPEKGFSLIKKGGDYFWEIIENKGFHLFDSDDAYRIHKLISGLAHGNFASELNKSIQKLENQVIPNLSGYLSYFKIVISLERAIETLLEEGDTHESEIKFLTDIVYKFAKNCPPNERDGEKHYKMKIYSLAKTSILYGKLKESDKVDQIINLVEKIRNNDGLRSDISQNGTYYLNLTKEETWSYIPYFIEAAAYTGNTQLENKADQLVATFPEDSRYINDAYSAQAAVKAALNKTDEAIEIVKSKITESTDDKTFREKIEALTSKTEINPKIAAIAIKNKNYSGAHKALNLASVYADHVYNSGSDLYKNLYKVQRGYLKIAKLYHEAGDSNSAEDIFSRTLKVLEGGTLSGYTDKGTFYSYDPEPITGIKYYIDAASEAAAAAYETENTDYRDLFIELAQSAAKDAFFNSAIDYDDKTDFLLNVIEFAGITQRKDIVSDLKDYAAEAASYIASDSSDEDDIVDETEELIKLAGFLSEYNSAENTEEILKLCLENFDKVYSKDDKTDLLEDTAIVFAKINMTDKAIQIAEEIEYKEQEFDVITEIARLYALRDDFPESTGVSIDLDGDGKPYFYSPELTKEEFLETGLILDDDSDGDGTKDIYDQTPLYKD